MLVHYIWIGPNSIPSEYLSNLERCKQLNPQYEFKIWGDDESLQLLRDNDYIEYWSSLPNIITKVCFLRYLILNKYGGVYSDFDINWKISFDVILEKNIPDTGLLLTFNPFASTIIDNKNIYLLDDPFIYSEKNKLDGCIDYCKSRTELKNDGDWYLKTGELRQHPLEPVGPFGLTEWVYYNDIDINYFSQVGFIDQLNGKYGIHAQNTNWK
jgi:hypothetical protein